jgi:5-methylcytosine-specific restriction enzyme B
MILDERVAQELRERYKALEIKGIILSHEQLAEYYDTFRNKFGPEKLKNLDGEALLNTMHEFANRDSLAYWLEFKDDEEFPARFGSISGGSAHKFGLFRKRETGKWTTGSPMKEIQLSPEQAIEKARQHREQLIRGFELLEQLPIHGTDKDYEQLQLQMNHLAPDVSNSAWGHKYFSLLFPEKLDDYHNAYYQHFHLIKLLQIPPHGWGRYLWAGRYVAIADEMDFLINNLTRLLNDRDGNPYSYWRIGTSETERGQKEFWPSMKQGNYCAIRWPEVGDLTDVTNTKEGSESIRRALKAYYPTLSPQAIGTMVHQIFPFRWRISVGDLVLATDGHTVIGIGRIAGGYRYDPTDNFPHRRDLEWLSFDEWKLAEPEANTTAYKLKKDINLTEAEKHILGASPIQSSTLTSNAPFDSSTSAINTNIVLAPPRLKGISAQIEAILERKGQVVLYGPPGTGKTFWAENTARELAARTNFNKTFEQLTKEEQVLVFGGDDQQDGFVRLCSFHPAYGYEDFLEGFRPIPVNGQMHFILRDGIFKKLCKDAECQQNHKLYLIIDEINRGDIPRIFGELLTVLEKDKRGKTILLPLTGMTFRVPNNVFIIGTMNTADRSIALLDTALRRRFGFIELMPDINILGDAMVGGIPLGPWLKALNERICEFVGRDARNLQIGHSYLLEKGRPVDDFVTFTKILQEDILPLLEEYCYEDYVILEKILGPGMVDLKQQQVRQELFASTNRDILIQALLAPAPDITTSQQAISSEAKAVEEEEEENGKDSGIEQP